MSLTDDYTGNQSAGKAAQTGFLDFWSIATAQSVCWTEPYTMSNLHGAETMLIQLGAEASGYGEYSTVTAAMVGLQATLATSAVVTVDIGDGTSIELDMVKGEMTTNKAFLVGTHIKANQALEVDQIVSHCRAVATETTQSIIQIQQAGMIASIDQTMRG